MSPRMARPAVLAFLLALQGASAVRQDSSEGGLGDRGVASLCSSTVPGLEITAHSSHGMTAQQLSEAASLLTAGSAQSGLMVEHAALVERLDGALSVVLAEKEGHVLGVIALKKRFGDAECLMSERGYFALDPSLRGTGVGQCVWEAMQGVVEKEGLTATLAETLISNYPSLSVQFKERPAPVVAGFMNLQDGRSYALTLSQGAGHALEGGTLEACKRALAAQVPVSKTLKRSALHAAVQSLPASSFMTPEKRVYIEGRVSGWFGGALVD